MKILNVKFVGLEFDFGYSEDSAEDRGNHGRIDAEVFVQTETDGEQNTVTHRARLDGGSFADFLTEEQLNELNFGTDFSSALQKLRHLITLRVASDLGAEMAGIGYIAPAPLRDEINLLQDSQTKQDEAIMLLMLGGM